RIEIHSVNPGDKSQRNENRSHNCQDPDDLVCPDVSARKVEIHEVASRIPERFQHIHNKDSIVVTVAEKRPGAFGDQAAFIANQLAENIPLRPNGATNSSDEPSEIVEFIHSFSGGLIKKCLLEIIHR